jgi:urease accessory protein
MDMSKMNLGAVMKLGVISLIASLFAASASAHEGIHTHSAFLPGLQHPWLGLDHLVAAFGVGLVAARYGALGWRLPAAFVLSTAFGAMAGLSHQSDLAEWGIVATLVAISVWLAAGKRVPVLMGILATGCFGIFHGWAHGASVAADPSSALFVAGVSISTALLHLFGILAGKQLNKISGNVGWNAASVAMALASGVVLAS